MYDTATECIGVDFKRGLDRKTFSVMLARFLGNSARISRAVWFVPHARVERQLRLPNPSPGRPCSARMFDFICTDQALQRIPFRDLVVGLSNFAKGRLDDKIRGERQR